MALLAAMMAAGCDEGKIYPDERESTEKGLTLTLTGTFEGCAGYENSDYGIVVAAFREGEDFAVVSRPLADGDNELTLKNIDASVSSAEICVISRLRERIVTIASMPIVASESREVHFDAGRMDVRPFFIINHNILATSCVQCHGATGTSAATLNLTATESYRNLVNAPSTVMKGEVRVQPGDASASTLWQALATDMSESWKFDHSNLLTPEKSGFIKEWIDNGADN